jgi:hypothetical protein
MQLQFEQPEEVIAQQIQTYLTGRAYRISGVDDQRQQVVYEGYVRPSIFMAVLLTLLATIGLMCLRLVLSVLFPEASIVLYGLLLLAPLAGLFYWRGAGRIEQVVFKIEPGSTVANSQVTVSAHRDELAEFQRQLSLAALTIRKPT